MLGSLTAALRAPKAIAALGSPKAIAALGSLRALAAFGALAALGAALAVLVPGGTAPPPPGSPGDERATGSELAATAPAAIPSGRATRFVGPSPAMLAATDAVALSSPPSFGPVQIPPPSEWHEFYFTRAAYRSGGGGWGRRRNSWRTDYPKADRQFLTVLQRLTNLDAFSDQNAVWLTDENIRRYPFLYALEVGYMNLSEAEVEGLREYLTAGGFLMIDDFWGSYEWDVFEWNIRRVFPNLPIIELDTEHPVFNTLLRHRRDSAGARVRALLGGRDVGARRVHAAREGDRGRERAADGRDQLEHRPGRRLGVGGAARLPAAVLDVRVPDGREHDRLRDEPLAVCERASP